MNNKVKLPSCVIMAGGRGVRLGAITKNTPKPILKIYNKPYLSYLIQWLSKNGLSHLISEVTAEKPRAFAYIDDKAIRFSNWQATIDFLVKMEKQD